MYTQIIGQCSKVLHVHVSPSTHNNIPPFQSLWCQRVWIVWPPVNQCCQLTNQAFHSQPTGVCTVQLLTFLTLHALPHPSRVWPTASIWTWVKYPQHVLWATCGKSRLYKTNRHQQKQEISDSFIEIQWIGTQWHYCRTFWQCYKSATERGLPACMICTQLTLSNLWRLYQTQFYQLSKKKNG